MKNLYSVDINEALILRATQEAISQYFKQNSAQSHVHTSAGQSL